MKKFVLMLACAVFLGGFAAEKIMDIRPGKDVKGVDAPSAVEWQDKRRDAIAEATTPEALKAYVADEKAADALLAEVKTGYATCPMKATVIAAVSQFVMRDDCRCPFAFLAFWRQSKEAQREIWSEALLRAAASATASDVVEFYLDQLRWCGAAEQASCVRAIGEKSACPCVKQMAELVEAELKQSEK